MTDAEEAWEFLVRLHGVSLIAALPREEERLNNTQPQGMQCPEWPEHLGSVDKRQDACEFFPEGRGLCFALLTDPSFAGPVVDSSLVGCSCKRRFPVPILVTVPCCVLSLELCLINQAACCL